MNVAEPLTLGLYAASPARIETFAIPTFEAQSYVSPAVPNPQNRIDADLSDPQFVLIAYKNGALPTARIILEQLVVSTGWRNREAVDALYELYTDSSMMHAAENLIRRSIENGDWDARLQMKLADLMNQTNRAGVSEKLMLEVIEAEPTNVSALELYHNALRGSDHESAYFDLVKSTIQKFPAESSLYLELASAYRDSGDHAQAEQTLLDGIDATPPDQEMNSELVVILADIMNQTNRHDAAKNLMLEIVAREPTNAHASRVYHDAVRGDGHESSYYDLIGKLIEENPTETSLYAELSYSYADAGDDVGAEQILLDGIEANPGDHTLETILENLYHQ